MVNTKVTLCGIEMDNPIIPASGKVACTAIGTYAIIPKK